MIYILIRMPESKLQWARLEDEWYRGKERQKKKKKGKNSEEGRVSTAPNTSSTCPFSILYCFISLVVLSFSTLIMSISFSLSFTLGVTWILRFVWFIEGTLEGVV